MIKFTGGTPEFGFSIKRGLLLYSVTGIFMLKFTEDFFNVAYLHIKMFSESC